MKNISLQLSVFIAGFLLKPAAEPEPETEASYAAKMRPSNNHEMWRTCNSCAWEFDVKKEKEFICPKCGSVDLRFQYKN